MDAVKFLKEGNRLCNTVENCCDCPLDVENLCKCNIDDGKEEKTVAIVEQWSKEHPILTNRQKFEEIFGTGIRVVEAPGSWWCAEYKPPKKGEE